MVLKAPLVTCGCAMVSALWLCRREVELSNWLLDRKHASHRLSACLHMPLTHHDRPNSTTTSNSIGCAELYFLDSVPLVRAACHHNSSSAHLMPSCLCDSAAGWLKIFRYFRCITEGFIAPDTQGAVSLSWGYGKQGV